jgi:hypothetical protein
MAETLKSAAEEQSSPEAASAEAWIKEEIP